MEDREHQKEKARKRRIQKDRMIRRAVRHQKDHWFSIEERSEEDIREAASRLADNLQRCSCHMCGNERKHFNEVTIQEKRNLDEMKDQIKDLEG